MMVGGDHDHVLMTTTMMVMAIVIDDGDGFRANDGDGDGVRASDGDGGVDRGPYSRPVSFLCFVQVGLHYLRTWFVPDLWCSLPYSTMQPLLQPLLEEVRCDFAVYLAPYHGMYCDMWWCGLVWCWYRRFVLV